jgi:hypothetical protein
MLELLLCLQMSLGTDGYVITNPETDKVSESTEWRWRATPYVDNMPVVDCTPRVYGLSLRKPVDIDLFVHIKKWEWQPYESYMQPLRYDIRLKPEIPLGILTETDSEQIRH